MTKRYKIGDKTERRIQFENTMIRAQPLTRTSVSQPFTTCQISTMDFIEISAQC